MTPDEAGTVIDALGDAFAAGDVERVVAMFAAEGDVIYAGSESGEVAVGRPALRKLLGEIFARDERYAWKCHAVHVADCPAGFAVLAEATLYVDPVLGTDRAARPTVVARESFPYRVSGLLENGNAGWRWRFCHGSEPALPASS